MHDVFFEDWYRRFNSKITRKEAKFYSGRILKWINNFIQRRNPNRYEARRLSNICRNLELPVLDKQLSNIYELITKDADKEVIKRASDRLARRLKSIKRKELNLA